MWRLPANLHTVGPNMKNCGNRRKFQHCMDGRRICEKDWRGMPHCRRKKSATCSSSIHNTTRMRTNTFKPTMYPIRWPLPDVLAGGREWIRCFQSHIRGTDITRRKTRVFVHFSNRPRFEFQSPNSQR